MKRLLSFCALMLLGSLLARPAAAGGWVVVTLDAWPETARAGEALDIGFTVRQHGQTLASGLKPVLVARHAASGERLVVAAEERGDVGHYAARVAFPESGAWALSIRPEPFPQEFTYPDLEVLPGSLLVAAPKAMGANALSLSAVLRLGGVAAVLAAVGLYGAMALAGRRRGALALPAASGGGS